MLMVVPELIALVLVMSLTGVHQISVHLVWDQKFFYENQVVMAVVVLLVLTLPFLEP